MCLGERSGLICNEPTAEAKPVMDCCESEFVKFPPVMRCAMMINGIKRFEMNYFIRRYSLAVPEAFDFSEPHDFVLDCEEIMEASGRDFVPVLSIKDSKNSYLWNWTREENHRATMTYRHYLMPLWAGSSGHSAGLIEFYSRHLNGNGITVDGKWVSIAAIILPTMFAFWRLYYDKRISAVHTLAETFEAGYSFELRNKDSISEINKLLINSKIRYEGRWISSAKLPVYEDPFDTVAFYPPDVPNTYGVVNSVRIMAQIKKKHYRTLEELDDTINKLRTALAEKYQVPQWSKPIRNVDCAPKKINEIYDSVFRGLVIRSFSNLNVRTFQAPKCVQGVYPNGYARSERLFELYHKIAAVTGTYNFAEDFENLPFVIEKSVMPFLSAVTFSNIKDCVFEETEFTFTALIQTDASFWESVKPMVPVREEEEIFCVVTEQEGNLDFSGKINVNSDYQAADGLLIHMEHILINSGLDERSCQPHILAAAEMTDGELTLDVTAVFSPGSSQMYIKGTYEDGKVLTILKLLSLLGVDKVIPVTSILPDEEGIFGSLGIRELSIDVSTDPVCVSHIDFTITAEKPWDIFGGKISLQPYFEINLEYPFDDRNRKVDTAVLGMWNVGTSVFELICRSDQIIIARLAQESVLNFAELARLFAINVRFPEIKLTGMEMIADLAGKNYSLFLSAEDVLKFHVKEAEIGISDVIFSLDFADGRFGKLALAGTLDFGGLSLCLSGAYDADGGFEFEAMAYAEFAHSFGDFIVRTAKQLSGKADLEAFPKDFLAADIRMVVVSYQSEQQAFLVYADFEHVLKITDEFSIDEFSLKISSEKGASIEFETVASIWICETVVTLSLSKENGAFIISGTAVFEDLTFADIARELGIHSDVLPDFIMEFTVTKLAVSCNLTNKDVLLTALTGVGEISAGFKKDSGWQFSYKAGPACSIDMQKMPLAGEIVQKMSPGISDFEIRDFEIAASTASGVLFQCVAFAKICQVDIYKKDEQKQTDLAVAENAGSSGSVIVKWIELNKNFGVLSVPKIGIGLDGSRAVLLLDASLHVSPFSFSMAGAGIGVNFSKLSDITFYLSGFGVAFDNGVISIAGSFSRSDSGGQDVYTGTLLVKCKTLAAMAVGEYSAGSFMGYLTVSASIGGPPAFYVTGLSLGFGYNKKLLLPKVEEVPKYPLITAAREGFQPQILKELRRNIQDENGQNFLTAGVKFTSFQMVNGFLLLLISFGEQFEIGVLGIADISVPPNVTANPIAKAQLALKANYSQAEGVFFAEARLTSESYILSRSCRLTGGFAACFWFSGSEHEGDFVITLGGYHPAYQKPEHYPAVPRLGLNWNINKHLNISGEIYFALTPGAVMAGGKLSAVYARGNLKAWFLAYADFLVSWKPFYYQAEIGVSLGASYRVDCWLVHKTFSIELAAKLALWGPEIQGRLHISWFILSFTIAFSEGADIRKKSWTGMVLRNPFCMGRMARQMF